MWRGHFHIYYIVKHLLVGLLILPTRITDRCIGLALNDPQHVRRIGEATRHSDCVAVSVEERAHQLLSRTLGLIDKVVSHGNGLEIRARSAIKFFDRKSLQYSEACRWRFCLQLP